MNSQRVVLLARLPSSSSLRAPLRADFRRSCAVLVPLRADQLSIASPCHGAGADRLTEVSLSGDRESMARRVVGVSGNPSPDSDT
jgi:hypothetical protein